jgi:hypothetical protein
LTPGTSANVENTWGPAGGGGAIFVNGANKGSSATVASIVIGATIDIGQAGNTNALNGAMKNLKVWTVALSDGTIAAL